MSRYDFRLLQSPKRFRLPGWLGLAVFFLLAASVPWWSPAAAQPPVVETGAEPVGEAASAPPTPPVEQPPVEQPPATAAENEPPKAPPNATEVTPPDAPRVTFSFRFQPWEDVLEWFAEQAGYSLVMDAVPPGTFNYSDNRSYTPSQAIDLLNSILLTKGYTLVLRDRMLMLVNLEDGVPPNLVDSISVEDLAERGDYELVSCVFHLTSITAQEAQQEIENLIGPQGSVVVLPKARDILVTETAGKLRTIHAVIQRADGTAGTSGDEKVQWFELKFASAEGVLAIVRQLFNIPPDQNASPDGTIRFALDPLSSRLLVSGNAKKLEEVGKILEIIDEPGTEGAERPSASAPPQLQVYDTTPADPESVLKVMQTLLVGHPGVRLATDPKTGSLVALGRPEDHATIQATLDQMQRDAQRMEVFRLRVLDPQLAVLAIGKLFASEGTKAPGVDADPSTRQLLVRGSQAQIEQIRSLLEKMGEPAGTGSARGSGNVRLIPFTGPAAEDALQRLQEMWPRLHDNPIRVVTPSELHSSLPGAGPQENSPPERPRTGQGIIDQRSLPPGSPEASRPGGTPAPGDVLPAPPMQPLPAKPEETTSRERPASARFHLASDPASESPEASQPVNPPQPPASVALETDGAEPEAKASPPSSPAAIVVAPSPGGLMIASEDQQALDDFEQLLNALASRGPTGPKVTVFYLKHAKAQTVAETLSQILGGTASSSSTAGPPPATPAGPPEAASGSATATGGGSGALGYVLSPGGTGSAKLTGSVHLTSDPRLNALFVQASPADVTVIEQLLQVLDQREGPDEILAQAKPRLIPVYNSGAAEIADIVRQVYQNRMVAGTGGGAGGRGFNPMDFLQMQQQMMRGRGGDGGQGGNARAAGGEQVERLSIGVDPRTNSVIVCASDTLFQEVKALISELDQAAVESNETVGVVSLHGANPQVVQEALATLMGDSAHVGITGGTSSTTSTSRSRNRSGSTGTTSSDADRMQRRMEFFRSFGGGMGGPGVGPGGPQR